MKRPERFAQHWHTFEVVGGSLADRAGLRDGDILDQLEGLGNLDINAVDRLLVTSRDKIELIVHRLAKIVK
ncbi:unnamed protein product [Nippostrongylus brasiliensis]|uniref:SAM domain-containing protein n=1 Tax=Nippostrongylus brasiliensis TaxID=27835 RepID=A0A0N4Y134_NIPBR|nr:unnamed protein product [Nippostrongylus brasiliensis]